MKYVKIGTRGSKLALIQTDMVIEALKNKYSDIEAEKVIISTKGDKITDKPLIEFGGKGVFVTEIEEALISGRIDMAVHSAKDMPTELGYGLITAGVLKRDDARDVFVSCNSDYCSNNNYYGCDYYKDNEGKYINKDKIDCTNEDIFEEIIKGINVIGTGSLRRQFQARNILHDIEFKGIRGNVTTRLDKMKNKEYDGLILSAAGLKRLGLDNEPDLLYRYFSYDEIVPSGGQGIIAVETREDYIAEMIKGISDKKTFMEFETERYILKLLDAGCHEAVGVISFVYGDEKEMIKIIITKEHNGRLYRQEGTTDVSERFKLADTLSERLVNSWE